MTCKLLGETSKSRGKDAKKPWRLKANTTPSLKTKLVVWPLLTNTGGSCPHEDSVLTVTHSWDPKGGLHGGEAIWFLTPPSVGLG